MLNPGYTTISKFLLLGLPLAEAIEKVTAAPARAMGTLGEIGTLQPGESLRGIAVFGTFHRHPRGLPTVGESLFFIAAGRDLITSPVLNVERPPREVVHAYPM